MAARIRDDEDAVNVADDIIGVTVNDARFRVNRAFLPHYWNKFRTGKWEPDTVRAIYRFVTPGSLFLDIGAFVGTASLHALSLGAEVHAFEPDPMAYAELERLNELNPEIRGRFHAHGYALAPAAGEIEMYSARLGNAQTSVFAVHERQGELRACESAISVRTEAVATVLADLEMDRVSMIKIDVEGAEYDLLPAMAETLERHRPTLHVSFHSHNINSEAGPLATRLLRTLLTLQALRPLLSYEISVVRGGDFISLGRAALYNRVKRLDGLVGSFLFTREP